MRSPLPILLLIVCLGFSLGFSVGCVDSTSQPCEPCCDQFPCDDCPQDCDHCPDRPDVDCPDGKCPYAKRTILTASENSYGVVANATADDVRSGEEGLASDCIPCQPWRIVRPPTYVQPRVIHPRITKPSPADEAKTGSFACERCGKATVGKDWHVTSTDTGMSLMFMCERCWQSTGITERKQVLEKHLRRHGVAPEKAFYMRAAISEGR